MLVSGPDFVSDARLAPDGVTLSWLQWNHPHMPWDAAQLVVRAADGTEHVLAGGPGESVVQPVWGDDLALWWLSDRTDFWSLYRRRPHGEVELVCDVGSDIGGPQWVFGQRRFALLADGRVALAYGRAGADRLAVLEPDGSVRELDVPFSAFRCVNAQGTAIVCVAGSPSTEPVVLRVDVDGGEPEILRPARDLGLDPAWFSRPEHVTFPTAGRRHRHRRRRTRSSTRRPTRRPPRPTATCRRCWSWSTAARPPPPRPVLEPRRPVLDLPRVLRRRRRLPRLGRLRPPLPGRPAGPLGHASTSTTSSPAPATSPTAAASTPPAWRSPAARPAATRRWPR